MKLNIKKIGLVIISASLIGVAVTPTTTPVYATGRSKIVKINGIKMTMKEFERRLNKAKVVYYASREEIDKALKQGGKVKPSKKIKHSKKTGVRRVGIAPAVAAMAIPGVGEAVLTAGGVILIGGVALAAGSALYKKVVQLFAKNSGRYKMNKSNKEHRTHQSKRNRNKHQKGRKRVNNPEKKKLRKSWNHNK